MVFSSLFPPLDIPKVNFARCYFETLRRFRDKKVLIDAGTNRELTGDDILKCAFKFASFITRNSVYKQDVVALACSNCVEYPVVFLGNALCNVITTTCNPRYTYDEIVKQFKLCNPKCVVTDFSELAKMKRVAKAVPSIQKIWTIDGNQKTLFEILRNEDGTCFPNDVETDPLEDIVLLPFSSGTTGVPKGVMLTHYNFTTIHYTQKTGGGNYLGSISYNVLPMFHIYGFSQLLGTMMGGQLITDKRFGVTSTLEAIQKYKVTYLSVVPSMLKSLAQSEKLKDYDLSSLMAVGSGGSALSPSDGISMMQKAQTLVLQGYGLTEAYIISVHVKPGMPLNSAGFLCYNTRIKIVDPQTKKELSVNQSGEVLVKGPFVTKGYYKNPKATREAFDEEGWFKTGDIGYLNEDGMLFLVDRMKELIKYKSFQVAPNELEEVITSHPKVKDVAVIGIKDSSSGEVPKAFVVRGSSNLTSEELHKFVESKVSKYKFLRGGIEFVAEIPKGATGKILRRNLRDREEAKAKL